MYAHTLPQRATAEWEPLWDHLRRVAEGDGDRLSGAAQFASAFGAADWGRLLGWWHDLGKYSEAFQRYLLASAGTGEDLHQAETTGRVDHSTAGAQLAASKGKVARLLAYCIAGHHAGLPDNVGGESSLDARLKKQIEPYDAAPAELLARTVPPPPKLRPRGDARTQGFSISFFTRMMFSCLVDADFLATEWYVDSERSACRTPTSITPQDLLSRLNEYLDQKQRDALPTPVNARRKEVLNACRAMASLAPGVFSLNVPTGGGKTLSSLAFALSHASNHALRRIVYAIPFTSIIEQTANVFRDALGDFKDEVLEHHSNLPSDEPDRQTVQLRLAAENFDAPLIVTTNVQLFESLFANRTSRCRKLHRLAKSVIILDEAQTLPPNLLAPTLAALDELVRNYGVTVVLCTATQPAIERTAAFPIGLEGVRPIIDDPVALHESLRRTRIERVGKLENHELVARLNEERRVLCIVNSRRHAAEVFRLLNDAEAFHLSANMCATHRSAVVQEIHERLKHGNAGCRVVSTQVIEAGVDVDFPVVYRAVAGLDAIAQAAGRCNREGLLADESGRPLLGRVVVFDYNEEESRPPPFIRQAADHFREVAPDHADLLAPTAIDAYFRLHYWNVGGDDGRGWDVGRGALSVMQCFGNDGLHHQFRQAAERYQIIDDAQRPVIVPYGKKGRAVIRELEQMPDALEPGHLRNFDRRAQRYVVGVHDFALRALQENQVLLERHGRYYLANEAAYDAKLGLLLEVAGFDSERLII